jgi:hypothetical protein
VSATGLGRYGELVTALLTVFLVIAAVAQHALLPTGDANFLDAAALLALGATYGKQSAANGYAKQVEAAHKRLDKIKAPPADDGQADGG